MPAASQSAAAQQQPQSPNKGSTKMPIEYAEHAQRSNIEQEFIEYAMKNNRISEAADRASGIKVTVQERQRTVEECRAQLRAKAKTIDTPAPPHREGPLRRHIPTRT